MTTLADVCKIEIFTVKWFALFSLFSQFFPDQILFFNVKVQSFFCNLFFALLLSIVQTKVIFRHKKHLSILFASNLGQSFKVQKIVKYVKRLIFC